MGGRESLIMGFDLQQGHFKFRRINLRQISSCET